MVSLHSNIHDRARYFCTSDAGPRARNVRSPLDLGRTNETWDKRVFRSYRVNRLTLFGLFAVTAMLVCYAFENRSRWFILAFSVSCLLGSAYGFLQGAWPFGVVEAVWSVVALRR